MLALGLLLPALDNHLVSDDWVFVYRGAVVDDIGEVFDEMPPDWFSRPAIWVLSYVLVHVGGFEPWIYRAFLAVLHLLNTVLLCLLCLRLLSLWPESSPDDSSSAELSPSARTAALGVAALFMVHSLNHEVLYWYSAVTDGLIVALRLAALCWLAGCLQLARPSLLRVVLAAPLAAVLTLAALASKESAAVLPGELMLLVAVHALRAPSVLRGRHLALAAAMVAGSSAIVLGWLRWYLSGGAIRTDLTLLELGPLAWLMRLGQAIGRLVVFGKVAIVPWQVVVVLLVVAACVAVALVRRQRALLFALLWMVLGLLPTVAITAVADVESQVPVLLRLAGIGADRYYYGPSAALALALIGGWLWSLRALPDLVQPWLPQRRLRAALFAGGVVVLGGWATLHAVRLWRIEVEWDRAGDLLVATRQELADELVLPVEEGEIVCIEERPDSYRGRYILRSGITELVRLRAGHERFTVLAPPWTAQAACTRHLELGDELGEEVTRAE